ncbi:MAG: GNAT family N-acetyltransferase [Knoellia sp.]
MSHDHGGADHAHAMGPTADASVRTAKPTDAPAVGVVQAAVWTQAYAGRLPDEVVALFEAPAFAKAWRQSLESPPEGVHRLLVARAGEQVVGFAAIGPSQDPDAGQACGEVTAIGVHPGARRMGHGSRLLNACVDTMRGAGAEDMAIWVLADDEATRAFLVDSGLGPDGAFRDRVVSPDGDTLREVRLVASLAPDDAAPQDTASKDTASEETEPGR